MIQTNKKKFGEIGVIKNLQEMEKKLRDNEDYQLYMVHLFEHNN